MTPEEKKIHHLENEVARMKNILSGVMGRGNSPNTVTLREALTYQEVDDDILDEMDADAGIGDTSADVLSSAARLTLSNYLEEHLKFSGGIKLNRHGSRIVAVLGTTGVGKTTTLAKIAAKFMLDNKIEAVLITADTYRISAVEQLKTYSDILGLPLEIVYSPAELSAALDRHKDRELILIDTAGRSRQSFQQMQELKDLLSVHSRIEKHLVLSATTKITDAHDILEKFSIVEPEKIIITKVDETGTLGVVLNLLKDKNLMLSYLTTGQGVPEDIELANVNILTDLIMKKIVGEQV
ncbi:MAG: AAA family ATPase, partial [Selenomonadaceae bacterium]|nr:AAA family ATPase [Selenomonadaceae bacterium]